jgi:hypothetical protein
MTLDKITNVLTGDTRPTWAAQVALSWFRQMEKEILRDGGDFVGRTQKMPNKVGRIALLVLGAEPNCEGARRVGADEMHSIVANWLRDRRIDELQYSPNLHSLIFGDK